MAIIGVASTDRGRHGAEGQHATASSSVASAPRTTMISPEGNSAVISLTMASLITNAAEPDQDRQ